MPLGQSAAAEIGSWPGLLSAKHAFWEARVLDKPTALVIPESQVLPLEAALNVVTGDAAKKYGTDPFAELHGHALMNATEPGR